MAFKCSPPSPLPIPGHLNLQKPLIVRHYELVGGLEPRPRSPVTVIAEA